MTPEEYEKEKKDNEEMIDKCADTMVDVVFAGISVSRILRVPLVVGAVIKKAVTTVIKSAVNQIHLTSNYYEKHSISARIFYAFFIPINLPCHSNNVF
jgi:hypothetical protein